MTVREPFTHWDATDYALNSQGQFAWALGTIERLSLAESDWVLDLGCGDGKVSAELARRVPSGGVVGLDNSPEMIALAQKTWGPSVSNLEFRLADVQAVDDADAFNLAFSNSALHWVPNHPAVLRGVARALKAGGRAVFSMGGRGTAAVVYRALEDLAKSVHWGAFLAGAGSPHHFFGPEEYNGWLLQAGLRPGRVALTPTSMRHQNLAALEGWLRTTWTPYTNLMPPALRPGFVSDLTNLVRARCGVGDGGAILLPMVNLEVEAEKPGQ